MHRLRVCSPRTQRLYRVPDWRPLIHRKTSPYVAQFQQNFPVKLSYLPRHFDDFLQWIPTMTLFRCKMLIQPLPDFVRRKIGRLKRDQNGIALKCNRPDAVLSKGRIVFLRDESVKDLASVLMSGIKEVPDWLNLIICFCPFPNLHSAG